MEAVVMAGMFYSLKEAAERLNKTEEELRAIAKEGKLREFRDGSELLFRVNEVEAMIPQTSDSASAEELEPESMAASAPTEGLAEIEASEEVVQDEEILQSEIETASFPELQADETEEEDSESSELDMILDIPESEEQESLAGMDEIEAEMAEASAQNRDIEQAAESLPIVRSKARFKAPPAQEGAMSQKLTACQRFVNGLRDDSPVVVILLFVFLCIVLSACGGLGYVIYKLF